jgi:guanylate kinase
MNRRGLLIILSSPSGAGKSTLAGRLRAWDDTLAFSISATTREARAGEVDGEDYFFVSIEAFEKQVADGEMLEHAQVFENYYGSPKGPVARSVEAGRDVLFDIDWQGAQQINNSSLSDHVLSIFILPPSIKELHRRLVGRGQDSAEVIERRMKKSWNEISHWGSYDYVIVNDDLDETEAKLKTIISAERERRVQQPGLLDHVRNLQTEYEQQS